MKKMIKAGRWMVIAVALMLVGTGCASTQGQAGMGRISEPLFSADKMDTYSPDDILCQGEDGVLYFVSAVR